MTYALSFSFFCPCFRQNANTTLSLQLPMKFGNVVQVETSRYLTKIATLRRKADREQLQVLAAKHTASLQLLCAAGGNQARSDARTEFKILERSPKGGVKLVVHIAVSHNPFPNTQPRWLSNYHSNQHLEN